MDDLQLESSRLLNSHEAVMETLLFLDVWVLKLWKLLPVFVPGCSRDVRLSGGDTDVSG